MLQIERRYEGASLLLRLTGAIDLGSILRLRDVAFSAIGERPSLLLLDLRSVSHIEIAGINTLVTIARVARLVKVCCVVLPSEELRGTLTRTGLWRLLPFEQDEQEPVAEDPTARIAPASSVPGESASPVVAGEGKVASSS
ncbi:MAG: STAS domain-containing protein [Capsulimonadales bacterium]|nr:STAS domain-containing protein [Capsulimonadales bacterium]